MLHVVTGPLYSDLEDALAEHLNTFRSHSSLVPLTIAVPSEQVRLRLQWALCAERDLSLFNIHILTFFQLALRLVEERRDTVAFQSDNFFHEWIHHLLRRRNATLPDFGRLTDLPGAWAALWGTIKDLKDGAVDAVFARDALNQTQYDQDPVCQSVLTLYDWYRQEQNQLQVFDCDDAARLACADVASSTFLSQQGHIWYYGFYDLTQVQVDLFHAIAQTYPTTVYFPLVRDHPAYHFAQLFFDRHILGLSAGRIQQKSGSGEGDPLRMVFTHPSESLKPPGGLPTSEDPRLECQIIQVAGIDDEAKLIAKGILRYAEERDIPWHDIGVVGRTLVDYERYLPCVFREHGIPFNTTMQRSIVEFPYVQGLLGLLKLPISNFQRDHVMDVLTSPCFQWDSRLVENKSPQPDLWDRASRRLGISSGLDEWKRFIQVLKKEYGKKGERQNPSTRGPMSYEQIQVCEETLQGLFEALGRLPSPAPYEIFVDHTIQLVDQFLVPSPSKNAEKQPSIKAWDMGAANAPGVPSDRMIHQIVQDQLEEIRLLTRVADNVSFPDFVATIERFIQGTSMPLREGTDIIDGVWVLDAMAARGFSFRVLFVVGVNENVFPRKIREDAFLRDPVRRFLDVNLGFKVPEKGAGYEEEQLLFYLLVNSASESVTLLTQRSDQHDRSAIPSWYVSEVHRCVGDVPVTVVPKRESEKRRVLVHYADNWLTPQESRFQWMESRCLPRAPFERDSLSWSVVQRGVATLACHESSSPRLNRFDGLTGSSHDRWNEMTSRGVSPTALEHYAACPFKFYAKYILDLEPVELPGWGLSLGPREVGNLLHQLLKDCVEELAEKPAFRQPRDLSRGELRELVLPIVDRVFRNYERWSATGYPLLWELQQDQLLQIVTQVIAQDFIDGEGDWIPVAFEEAVSGKIRVVLGNEQHELRLVGRVDRVDWSPSQKQARVIDYKFKISAGTIPSPQRLARDAIRGIQLQPPVYLHLAEGGNLSLRNRTADETGESSPCAGVWLYCMTPQTSEFSEPLRPVAFTLEKWKVIQPQFWSTMNTLLGGIQRGEYFIAPGSYCRSCDYRTICHRTHPMSRWRAQADRAQTKAHRNIRSLKLIMPSESGKTTPKK